MEVKGRRLSQTTATCVYDITIANGHDQVAGAIHMAQAALVSLGK